MPAFCFALLLACWSDNSPPKPDEPSPRKPGALVRLTHDGLDKYRPSWAPEGRHLLFARREADGSHIWQYVLDLKNPMPAVRRLTDRKTPEYNGAFSPDGAKVLFAAIAPSGTQGNLDIAAIHADGTGLKTVTDDGGKLVHQDWPAWSPDGRRFAFSSTHEGNQEIYTAAADGTERRPRDPESGDRRAPLVVARRPENSLCNRPLGRSRDRNGALRWHGRRAPDQQPRAR